MGKVWKFKKVSSIILALGVGVLIIVIASKADSLFQSKTTPQNERVSDTSWKEGLSVIPNKSGTVILGDKKGITAGSEATTTTDRIAREMLVSYALTQTENATTTLSDEDAQVIAEMLAEKALTDTEIPSYTEKNIAIIESTPQTIETYKKSVAATLDTFAKQNTVNELRVVAQALDTNNPNTLTPLTKVIPLYQELVRTLLATKTPKTFTPFHLTLLQNYGVMLSGVIDMQHILNDPLRGIRGVAKYRGAGEALLRVQSMIPTN